MKKRFIGIIVVLSFIFIPQSVFASPNKNFSSEEYDIDEFMDIWVNIKAEVDEETKYWTEDELTNKKLLSEYKKIAPKYGIEPGTKIILRGVLRDVYGKMFSMAETDTINEMTANRLIPCFTDEIITELLFLIKENVKIEGFLLKDEPGISSCEIISPGINDFEFSNTVSAALSEKGEPGNKILIEGVVENIFTTDEYLRQNPISEDSIAYSNFKYASKVGILSSTDVKDKLLFFISELPDYKVNKGDKIAFMDYISDYEKKLEMPYAGVVNIYHIFK